MRLFCLPHAGGSAVRLVRVLAPRLAEVGVEAVPVELPGRGGRWREPAYGGWAHAVRDLADRVAEALDDRPYALFGHSVGALLAYEVAQRLRDRGLRDPALLVVAARNPPHLPPSAVSVAAEEQSDEDLFGSLVALGGASPRAAGPLTYQAFLPALRDDLALARRYLPRLDRPPLDCRLIALSGRDDPLTSPAAMTQWARCGTGAELHTVPGGHFFVLDQRHGAAEVAGIICRSARSTTAGLPGLGAA
jgi:surfactin synthase thioesterase subunit